MSKTERAYDISLLYTCVMYMDLKMYLLDEFCFSYFIYITDKLNNYGFVYVTRVRFILRRVQE